MDHIFIKEEVEENYDVESVSSASDSLRLYNSPSYSSPYCNTFLKTSNASIPPTQRVFPSKINQEQSLSSKPPELKRKGPELDHLSKPKHPRAKPSLMSPPLFPTGPSFYIPKTNNTLPGYQQNGGGCSNGQDGGVGQEDEWRNIKVMLNCISGMVEKTQSAISILQQRQAEVANIRNAEELVAEVQDKATVAILEVKQAALEEINKAKEKQRSEKQSNCKDESCWNCGRPATETCSGCSLARYCGPFCQHKDWEDHARLCRANLTMEDISNSSQARGVAGSPPARKTRASNE